MSPISLILNILWFILGGFVAGLAWMLAALILCVTIIGLPWAPGAFRIGLLSFFPFGHEAVPRSVLTGESQPLGCLLNAVWFIFAGWWLALGHLVAGVGLCISIIGIPFGLAHFKLAGLALAPAGREIVQG
jgi:uncharacterized membrane protein YccF (DUF307 family)